MSRAHLHAETSLQTPDHGRWSKRASERERVIYSRDFGACLSTLRPAYQGCPVLVVAPGLTHGPRRPVRSIRTADPRHARGTVASGCSIGTENSPSTYKSTCFQR